MKRNLLLAAAVTLSVAGMAQTNRKAVYNKPVSTRQVVNLEDNAFPTAGTKEVKGPIPYSINKSGACSFGKFTSCVNAFAVGGGVTTYVQNKLHYNKDLNTVCWTSRMSADWPVAGTGLTNTGLGAGTYGGAIQATWLDVTNNTWDSMIIYRDSAFNMRARYPSGIIFNPAGNTNISGAYMVGTGPWTSGSGWGGIWYSARQPSGNFHSVTNAQEHNSVTTANGAPFGNVGNSATNIGFLNMDMTQVGQSVMVSGALFDPAQAGEVVGTVLGKANYSGGNFTWTRDSIVVPFYSGALGLINDSRGARIAFDATGQIGYAVFIGRLQTNFNNSADSTMMPIVYKTTDGGANWTRVLDGYDWRTCHPELSKNVGMLRATPSIHVTPYLYHGIDLTVDANGVLHFVTSLCDPYLDGTSVDSLGYTYLYNWDYTTYHPIIWDLMTDGNDWQTVMVDSILSSYVGSDPNTDSTANFSAWLNATPPFLNYGAHLTVSRASDGSKVFYGWGDTDPNVTGSPYNNAPDMMIKGFDVSSQNMTMLTNASNGAQNCFFSYVADQSYFDNSQSAWVVPFVYTVGRTMQGAAFKGTEPVDYYYSNCGAFTNASFNVPATVNSGCFVGIAQHANTLAGVHNYPNPFNHSTRIVVTLSSPKTIDLKVVNALGNLVYSTKKSGVTGDNTITFEASSLSAGVYYYTVSTGVEQVTKKMVIQK
jgi:hypothetical protein